MRQKLSLVLLLVATTIFNKVSGQQCQNIVNIPDASFKGALVAHGRSIRGTGIGIGIIDTNSDGEICESEAQAYTGTIAVSGRGISNLTGIEAFTKITKLLCSNNNITNLDLSKNTMLQKLLCYSNKLTSLDVSNSTALTILVCADNQLTSLDLSKNTALQELECQNNQLTSLDVSNSTALQELECGQNKLTSLDLSKNTVLQRLFCFDNQLTSLDLSKNTVLQRLFCYSNKLTNLKINNGNNTNITVMRATNNPNLTCIQVDANTVGTSPSGWFKDAGASYSVNCSLGIDDIELNSQEVSIYPNPVLDVLHVSLKHSEVKSVTVYNVLGAVVLQTTETSIGVQALPSGVYVVKVEGIKGRKFASKVVKK